MGTGRPSAKLLSLFAPVSMTVAAGSVDTDADAAHRRDVCHFSDDRLSAAQKLDFVHTLLHRNMAEVRMFLDHLEKYSPALVDTTRAQAQAAQALDRIATDKGARDRYFTFMRAEEEEVLPLARKYLTPDDWKQIDEAFAGNTDPLLGAKASNEYDALFRRIVHLAPPPIGVGPEN